MVCFFMYLENVQNKTYMPCNFGEIKKMEFYFEQNYEQNMHIFYT